MNQSPTKFNKSLFQNNQNPWRHQVFAQSFDAYFFVKYPDAATYHIDFKGVFNPFHFLNNLSENSLFVTNQDDSHTLQYQNTQWQFDDYYQKFDSEFADDRFLFWEGKTDKWAMVSDLENGFAVIGIEWQSASQVPFFYQDFLLSTTQVLAKLNLGKDEDAFLKNYAPSSVLVTGNEQNPVWVKYYFQGKVPTEDDKLFYWKNFEQLYFAVTKVLKNFKGIDMYADQAFWRRYKQNGSVYSSGSNAPVGGWQKYSYENCKKVATKFLTENEHLRLEFEGKTEEAEALYWANKNGLVGFMTFWVYANIEKTKSKGQHSDFHFLTYLHNFGNKEREFNQNFEFSYKKSLIENEAIETFVGTLIEIGFVKKVYRIEQPATHAKFDKNGVLKIERMYGLTPDFEDKELIIFEK
jgi:hypothetical protein